MLRATKRATKQSCSSFTPTSSQFAPANANTLSARAARHPRINRVHSTTPREPIREDRCETDRDHLGSRAYECAQATRSRQYGTQHRPVQLCDSKSRQPDLKESIVNRGRTAH